VVGGRTRTGTDVRYDVGKREWRKWDGQIWGCAHPPKVQALAKQQQQQPTGGTRPQRKSPYLGSNLSTQCARRGHPRPTPTRLSSSHSPQTLIPHSFPLPLSHLSRPVLLLVHRACLPALSLAIAEFPIIGDSASAHRHWMYWMANGTTTLICPASYYQATYSVTPSPSLLLPPFQVSMMGAVFVLSRRTTGSRSCSDSNLP